MKMIVQLLLILAASSFSIEDQQVQDYSWPFTEGPHTSGIIQMQSLILDAIPDIGITFTAKYQGKYQRGF
jgi:hypothetical protein